MKSDIYDPSRDFYETVTFTMPPGMLERRRRVRLLWRGWIMACVVFSLAGALLAAFDFNPF